MPDKAFCTEHYEYIVIQRHIFFSHFSIFEISGYLKVSVSWWLRVQTLEIDRLRLNPSSTT